MTGQAWCGVRQEALGKELAECAWSGRAARVAELLASGADPLAAAGPKRMTALMEAAASGLAECVRILAPRSDLRAQDAGGSTPLMSARRALRPSEEAERLLLPGSDPAQRDGDGRTALCVAAEMGRAAAVAALLPRSDADARDGSGRSPLMLAAMAGEALCAQELLGASDPFAADKEGHSALMLAAIAGSEDCVEVLLPASDIWAISKRGLSALGLARERGMAAVAAMMERRIAEIEREALAAACPPAAKSWKGRAI